MSRVRTPAHACAMALLATLACGRPVHAQTPGPPSAQDATPQDDHAQDDAQTLETLHVTAQRPPTEQEQFRSHLQRNWRPPRSAEQFGLDGGVPAWLGQQLIRGATATARSLPGWKREVQPAIARAPPLDDEQMDRSQELSSPGAQPR
ncbi:MAG TPA: hypothetical protein VFF71_10305 [Luteimonas sp.]|nr:hypothetical protein [Luteimonas sp.]